MSPEQAGGAQASARSDVFSFGLMIFELLTGCPAFDERSVLKVLQQIRSVEPDSFANRVEEPFRSLLRRMLVRDPKARTITMWEIEDALNQGANPA